MKRTIKLPGIALAGAALLLWLYYSAQIFLLGAEFTACLGGVEREPVEDKSKKS